MRKSSLVLLDQNGFTKKSIPISQHLISHWKKYIIGLSFSILLGVGLIINWVYSSTSEKYEQTIAQLENAHIDSIEKTKILSETMQDIDSFVTKVNELLAIKNLDQYSDKTIENSTENSIALLQSQTSQLTNLIAKLEETPIGIPHQGRITSTFGFRPNPFTGSGGENHSGIDLKGQIGDPVISPAKGVVVEAGHKGGYGNCVVVQHKNGVKTLYAHLNKIKVKPNQQVETGTTIGELGNTGRSTGAHLHYEVIENDRKVDPEKYMKL